MESQQSWDAFNLFMDHGNLERYTKLLARFKLFEKIIELPGDIVECGVFKGGGLLYWARLLEIFCPRSPRKVIGFDTFAGYPESTNRNHDKEAGADFLQKSLQDRITPEAILKRAENLKLSHRVELIEGDATVTIPEFVSANPGFRISMLNLDFDIYEPTLAALDQFFPRLLTGGVMVFDEYAAWRWGESDAVDHFFSERELQLKSFPWALSPTAYAIK